MPLSIKHPEADHLARTLAEVTGESITEAVLESLRERLERKRALLKGPSLLEEIAAIQNRLAKLPILDSRSAEEILGYDENGLPS